MSAKNFWLWLLIAAGLLGTILFLRQHPPPPDTETSKILPGLKVAAVTSIQVRHANQADEIMVERTNDAWQLTKPLVYPAQAAEVEKFLSALEKLMPATFIPEHELKNRFNVDEEFGFANPQATLIVNQGDFHIRLRLGRKTAPGDQVFLQVVGAAGIYGIYIVDADLLKVIPRTANDWRDTTLLHRKALEFDRVAVTNGANVFEVSRDAAKGPWRMTYPIPARADNTKLEDALRKLERLRIQQFVSDDPKADLEAFGLQPALLELTLAQGTNNLVRLQFGKSPSNDVQQVYARRWGQNAIVTVSNDVVAPWRASVNALRDPHLFTLTIPVASIEVRAQDSFTVVRQGTNSWRLAQQEFPVDAGLVGDLISGLSAMPIAGFANDAPTPQDVLKCGLASPAREYTLKGAATDADATSTNRVLVDLQFGTNQEDRVFVRRTDESSIYTVKLADLQRVPSASWQLRERRIWGFGTNDIARVTISRGDQKRQIIRNGPYSWSLAPGSAGIIDDLGVEESVRGLSQVSAVAWAARGTQERARYGFTDGGLRITIELKSGDTPTIEFGGEAPSTYPYAAVTLDGQLWIFEFPPALYSYVLNYLSVPHQP